MTPFTLPLVLLIHYFSLSLKPTVKDVLWTSFNNAFSLTCLSLPFVPKAQMDSKGCPMDSS